MDVMAALKILKRQRQDINILTYKENCYKNQQQNKVISIGTTRKPWLFYGSLTTVYLILYNIINDINIIPNDPILRQAPTMIPK